MLGALKIAGEIAGGIGSAIKEGGASTGLGGSKSLSNSISSIASDTVSSVSDYKSSNAKGINLDDYGNSGDSKSDSTEQQDENFNKANAGLDYVKNTSAEDLRKDKDVQEANNAINNAVKEKQEQQQNQTNNQTNTNQQQSQTNNQTNTNQQQSQSSQPASTTSSQSNNTKSVNTSILSRFYAKHKHRDFSLMNIPSAISNIVNGTIAQSEASKGNMANVASDSVKAVASSLKQYTNPSQIPAALLTNKMATGSFIPSALIAPINSINHKVNFSEDNEEDKKKGHPVLKTLGTAALVTGGYYGLNKLLNKDKISLDAIKAGDKKVAELYKNSDELKNLQQYNPNNNSQFRDSNGNIIANSKYYQSVSGYNNLLKDSKSRYVENLKNSINNDPKIAAQHPDLVDYFNPDKQRVGVTQMIDNANTATKIGLGVGGTLAATHAINKFKRSYLDDDDD